MLKMMRGSDQKKDHSSLVNELLNSDLNVINYESLGYFLDFLYNTQVLDSERDLDKLKETLYQKASDCGLSGHIALDFKLENSTPVKKGYLEIRLFNIKFNQPGEKLDSNLTKNKHIFFENNRGILGIKLYLENILFDDSEQPLGGNLSIEIFGNGHYSTLSLNNCCFSSVGLRTDSFMEVEISNCSSISPLIIGKETLQCIISNSSIGKISIPGNNLIYLRVKNSNVASIEENFFIEKIDKLKFLQFDYRSSVFKNKYATYKNLRMYAEKQKDKIQAFTLYKKELSSFSDDGVADFDSRILIFFNKITSSNGTSVLLPIFWLFSLNFLLVFLIMINERCFLGGSYMFNAMNVIPTMSLVDENFKISSQGMDALRRLFCGTFLFLTISSALRFKYKL